ncbi:MAG TPA: pyridoxal-dependent decarboxylase [Candidatus Sulfotelmatobacter sp.]|nr:pyridoxal-dependent decarboxylase [Candidatus Sulfotelmatobacter sp.]
MKIDNRPSRKTPAKTFSSNAQPRLEETLDPDNWEEMRELGHRMLDDMIDYLSSVRGRNVWQPVPTEVKQSLSAPLPLEPCALESVYRDFKQHILPYPTGNIHPRFWGWVMGTGTPVAMLAEMLAAGMNSWVGGFDQSATLVEEQVLTWLRDMLEFPVGSSGVLTSGCTVANIIGLTVARHAKAPFDVRKQGLQNHTHAPLVVYCSSEVHSWAQKAVELLGLGDNALHRVPVDSSFRMEIAALRAAVLSDRKDGKAPFCVIGTAGTVNTGAVDRLSELAALCRKEQLWFHIDGAFGALATLSPKWRNKISGLNLADSIAFDLHKWMYMPFEAGCVLVRDREAHHSTFVVTPSYLNSQGRGIAPQVPEFAARGIDLARNFKALKIWFSIRTHGALKFGRLIEQNIEQAYYLAALIEKEPHLELLAPVELNVVCFRFNPGGCDEKELDRINEAILIRIQESGVAVPSGTRVSGRFAIRVAVTNHRSRKADFNLLVLHVLKLGADVRISVERQRDSAD